MNPSGWKSPLLVENQPEHLWSRKVYALRNHLLRGLRQGQRSIMIASCWPGEGKSFLAANLACTFAQMAFRVLLIDANLANPTLSLMYAPTGAVGLLDLVEGRPAERLQPEENRMFILPCGQTRSGSRLALRRDVLAKVFATLRTDFDLILVDTTALSVNSDALLLGMVLDGCLMVVQNTKFQGIPEGHLAEDLREAGIPLLGTLVNG